MRALGSAAQMQGVLRAALAAGINHLETAPAYGPAERFLGQALQVLAGEGLEPRGGWLITSKLLPGCDLASGQEQLRAILRRLGVPALTTLAVHGLNLNEHLNWALRGAGAELLAWAVGEGLAGQVGFTSHGDNDLIERSLASGRFTVCGLHLHLLDRQRLPLARQALAEGIGVLAISPADKGGQLYAPPAELEADCAPFHPLELAYRFLWQQGISTLSLGAERPEDLTWAERLSGPDQPSPASPAGASPATSPATGVGAGAGATGAMAVGMAVEVEVEKEMELGMELEMAVERLDAAAKRRLGAEYCGQCRACLPCPNGVPIPELLRLRNLAIGHGMGAFASERYNLIGRAGHWWEQLNASACGHCGDCLPRCPHQLPIPGLLADTHQRLAAAPRRRLWG
jgi:predicted aldo/keto reductase-like oxidoreductase